MKQTNMAETAAKLIRLYLQKGEQPAALLIERGVELGISARTMRRAAHKIVYTEKRGDIWYWRLINPPMIEKPVGRFFEGLENRQADYVHMIKIKN